MKKFAILVLIFILLMSMSGCLFGRMVRNQYEYAGEKIDEATDYKTKKEVEDTCRAMISSYESDKLTYEQYNGGSDEQQSWADQAKMRANKTAVTYNNYILKNSYVWKNNVPDDIKTELEVIE